MNKCPAEKKKISASVDGKKYSRWAEQYVDDIEQPEFEGDRVLVKFDDGEVVDYPMHTMKKRLFSRL